MARCVGCCIEASRCCVRNASARGFRFEIWEFAMSEHDWFRDNLDLFAAGGLTPDESLRSERHAAECAACARELAQRRLLDRELGRLCAPVHFAADWDQRVQVRWQKTQRPARRLPAPLRWAGA